MSEKNERPWTVSRYLLQLPEDKGFARVDLQQDRGAELERVEK